MRPFRDLKLSSLITEELGKMFSRDFNFEGALVTIMETEVEKDLLHANVKLGIIPYEKSLEVYKIVSRAASDIRFKLLKKLNIKPMPYLKFEIVEPEKSEDSK
ncbi:MAG: Ribosome-binding factor A [Parcubacteria group bacterium LiPW_41]|nr:MAG: Ribosome-binding factor A [Parcubacteria group bacterium LiPW_41]